MRTGEFRTPVTVMVGLGYPRTVASALEAWSFLSEYPGDSREKSTALAACRAVMEGRTVPETAHFALIKFAQKKDILLDRPVSVTAQDVASMHSCLLISLQEQLVKPDR